MRGYRIYRVAARKDRKALVGLGEGGVVHVVARHDSVRELGGQVGVKFHFDYLKLKIEQLLERDIASKDRVVEYLAGLLLDVERGVAVPVIFLGVEYRERFAAEIELGDVIWLAVGFAVSGGFA